MRQFHPIPGRSSYRPPPSGVKPLPEEDPELWGAKNWGIPQRRKLADLLRRAAQGSNKAQVSADAVAQLLRSERPYAKDYIIKRVKDAIDFDLEKRPHAINEGEEPIGTPEKHKRLADEIHAFRSSGQLRRLQERIARLVFQNSRTLPLSREEASWCRGNALKLVGDLEDVLRGLENDCRALAAGAPCKCRLCTKMEKELNEFKATMAGCRQGLNRLMQPPGQEAELHEALSPIGRHRPSRRVSVQAPDDAEPTTANADGPTWEQVSRRLDQLEQKSVERQRAASSVDKRLNDLGAKVQARDRDIRGLQQRLRHEPTPSYPYYEMLTRQTRLAEDEVQRQRRLLDFSDSIRLADSVERLVRASVRRSLFEQQRNKVFEQLSRLAPETHNGL